ncbi:DUF1240 domain-containing protein [Vibrio aestuarianus]|uniref:DUF1240 domain-containing protein n=1 Tax=Vibrio aestuarianus TaxID=28171 RepID=UPI00237D0DD2|nr:DUF1240 domain-containing protein [Vibrio aestuarianus]MDE1315282.1 DUF1240 domain-containing protein [Vibrio aestuarianus]
MSKKPFRIITLKQRIVGFFGMLFMFIPLTIGSVWIGVDILIENWAFHSSLIFTWLALLLLFIPFISIPVIIIGLPAVFLGKDMPVKHAAPLIKIAVSGLVLGLIMSIVYGFYFTKQLEQRGYTPCRGIPSSHTPGPGMGKQYVTDLSLCNQ